MDYIKLHKQHKYQDVYSRYVTNNHIFPFLENLTKLFTVNIIGKSVKRRPIYSIKVGDGKTKILIWSQMHGNESTTTKALLDLLNTLKDHSFSYILKACSFYIIPILNPDGAHSYTRLNANKEDLNRDAQILSQPESLVLREAFNCFKPHFCFNLHGQRTIFSAGKTNKPATVSFLSPAENENRNITRTRRIAMELIAIMNKVLQSYIPNQVGVYDDSFNLNCVGDTFQSLKVPTILFEAAHYKDDYNREQTRLYIYIALLSAISSLSKTKITGTYYQDYLKIPQNEKLFYDIILRNCKLSLTEKNAEKDVGFLFKEEIRNNNVVFLPIVEKISNLEHFYGHKELKVNNSLVLGESGELLKEGYANDFVLINNELFVLKSIKN
ncbi:MAG: peptidase M14 [Bacteroidia bacterium]|nr:peptidase M14 [Bacteroidia bacterium]